MLLSQVRCEGYKAFAGPTQYNLAPVTVLFGKNNGGKTSLARLPLFSAASLTADPELLALHAFGVKFGATFADVASVSQPHPNLSFGLGMQDGPTLDVSLQLLQKADGRTAIRVAQVTVDGETEKVDLRHGADVPPVEQLAQVATPQFMEGFTAACSAIRTESASWLHVRGHRDAVARTYEARPSVGFAVEETPYLLSESRQLLSDVSGWFVEHLDGMTVDVDRGGFALRLITVLAPQQVVNLADVGRGPQAALPVVTTLMAVRAGICPASLLIIEEPEAHVHPSAHGALADLVIQASRTAQVVVETHSENFILRLRRRIAEGADQAYGLAHGQLSLIYVDDQHAAVPVRVKQDGTTTSWPAGVFEYDVAEAQAIVAARLAARVD